MLTALIDHHLTNIIRSRARYQGMMEEVARRTAIAEAAHPELSEAADITGWDRSQDVAAGLARLDAQDRAICEALADGEKAYAIIKRLKLTRRGLEHAMARIRSVFSAMGLDVWMGAR